MVGLSYSEIADALEVTLATVKWRIYKAREDVQSSLAQHGVIDELPLASAADRSASSS